MFASFGAATVTAPGERLLGPAADPGRELTRGRSMLRWAEKHVGDQTARRPPVQAADRRAPRARRSSAGAADARSPVADGRVDSKIE
jgi:hypothetical protein